LNRVTFSKLKLDQHFALFQSQINRTLVHLRRGFVLRGQLLNFSFGNESVNKSFNQDVDGKTMMNIGLNSNVGNDDKQSNSISGQIAHESGHAWLAENGIDI
jgi:hypothetical protein